MMSQTNATCRYDYDYYYYDKCDNKTKGGNMYEVHHSVNKWTPTSH